MIDHARPPLAVREQSTDLARQVERPPSPWRTVAIVAREIAPIVVVSLVVALLMLCVVSVAALAGSAIGGTP